MRTTPKPIGSVSFLRGDGNKIVRTSLSCVLRISYRRLKNFETVTLESYSYRNAIIGSTEDARRAGIKAASAEVASKSTVAAANIRGVWALP